VFTLEEYTGIVVMMIIICGVIIGFFLYGADKEREKENKKKEETITEQLNELAKEYGDFKIFKLTTLILVVFEKGILMCFNRELSENELLKKAEVDLTKLLRYEIKENNTTYSKGGITGAIIGGLLFGGSGAVVGAVTQQKSISQISTIDIFLYLDNFQNSTFNIEWYNRSKNEFLNMELREFIGTLDFIISKNQ
jgi:uncharacterized membrane protein YsdA (DUF1294 family)